MHARWTFLPLLCFAQACSAAAGVQNDAGDAGAAAGSIDESADAAPGPLRVLAFSRTREFRHDSIPTAQAALAALSPAEFAFVFSEEPAQLVDALAQTDVVLFLLTSGDVLDDAQQDALQSYVLEGGGFVGVHSASDTEYDWPFYAQLVGAYFESHPVIQPARVLLEATSHPAVRFLPAVWEREDEWYNFRHNPRAEVEVLLRLDESSYSGGTLGADHPIAWCRRVGRGRSLYTALGHTAESWSDPRFLRHVVEALRWSAARGGEAGAGLGAQGAGAR